jgi:hypothetical protein
MGACGHVLSRQALNDAPPRGSGTGRAYPVLKGPRQSDWIPGPIPGQGGRRNGLTGSEIMSAHDYHHEEKWWYGLLPGLVFYRLMAPPL